MNQSFISSLSNSKALIGTLVTLDSSEVVEILALAGFDWLFLDMEHGNLSIASVQSLCQAIAGRCHTLVRVPENAPIWIKKVLDIGCDGIIVPHVNTAEEAMQVIQAAKYPPKGQRSVGAARAQGYGHYFSDCLSVLSGQCAPSQSFRCNGYDAGYRTALGALLYLVWFL